MRVRGALAGLCLVLACAACSSDTPDETPPSTSPTPGGTSAPPTPQTIELRYTVKPRSSKLLQINLPPQPPGGTMITWSTYFQGIGTVGTPSEPVKAECYVVQATGRSFESRVLYVADDSSVTTGDDISLSGSGLVDTADGERLTFECEIDENTPARLPGLRWQTHPQQPIQVTLTPVDHERREVTIR